MIVELFARRPSLACRGCWSAGTPVVRRSARCHAERSAPPPSSFPARPFGPELSPPAAAPRARRYPCARGPAPAWTMSPSLTRTTAIRPAYLVAISTCSASRRPLAFAMPGGSAFSCCCHQYQAPAPPSAMMHKPEDQQPAGGRSAFLRVSAPPAVCGACSSRKLRPAVDGWPRMWYPLSTTSIASPLKGARGPVTGSAKGFPFRPGRAQQTSRSTHRVPMGR